MRSLKSKLTFMKAEITCADPEIILQQINFFGVDLFALQKINDLTYRVFVSQQAFPLVLKLCEQNGVAIRVLKHAGYVLAIRSILKRPLLVGMLIFFLSLSFILPTRILFIQVSGNKVIPAERVLQAADLCGVSFGVSRKHIRSEKVKNGILSALPELQWAGVNTAGCVATISVREREMASSRQRQPVVSSIVADRDGYILSGTVEQGSGLFQIGQTVKEGQILISGYTDCGIYIQAKRAEGEVTAFTNRSLKAVMPAEYTSAGNVRVRKKKISLILRKKRINLWKDSGISDSSCGRMYEEYYVSLPGGFQLPIALCIEEYIFYDVQSACHEKTNAEGSLRNFSVDYLTQQMIAGTIQHEKISFTTENGCYQLHGDYACTEMIGRERREQIGDTHGKNS